MLAGKSLSPTRRSIDEVWSVGRLSSAENVAEDRTIGLFACQRDAATQVIVSRRVSLWDGTGPEAEKGSDGPEMIE
jgi:hypothetical protein